MNLELRSNDSLDRQVSAYISEGRFHVSLLSLIALVAWVIYVFFYNARLFGILSSLVLRKFVKNGFLKIGSLSISPVCGKVMIRDLVYLTEDFSVRCCYVVIVLNYWKPFQLQARHLSKRRLYIHLYGLDLHVFNRTSVYDNLRKLFEIKPQTDGSDNSKDDHQHHPSLVIIHPDAPYPASTDRDPIHPETELASENSMGWIWTRCELLFPVVKFNLEMSKVTFGNHLMPRTLVLTCHKANGVYSTEPTSYSFGKYLHVMKLDFSNFMGSLAAVSKYSGHYAIEDPPKGADIFHVFNFGKGKITYEQDEPDWDLIRSAGSIGFDEGCQNTQDSPKWDMSINVSRDFLLAYGPWADRQREIIWKFFFPASYRPLEVPKPDERNPHQANERFLLKLISQTDVRLDLWFSTNRIPKTFSVYGKSNSVFELNLPWTSGADGFTSRMHLRLSEGRLVTDCLWQDLLLTSEFRMDLSIHYPLEWNALQTWDFDIDGKEAKCCFLYTQKDYFKEFFEDWSSGSRPDILSFVPYIYTFRINARPLELRLLANDFNWVAPTPENAFIAFCLKKFTFTFNLPFSEFLPTTVPVEFGIKGSTASCCLSLPETSTMLYVIKELHNNLKLVDCKCRPQQQNPFRIIEEVLEAEKGGQTGHKRYWIECWRAPFVSLRIVYTYHPIPWVPDFWRFLPDNWDLPDAGGPESRPSSSSLSASGRIRVDSELMRYTRTTSLPQTLHDPVEVALGGLRPEGSRAHGPTESALILADFNPGYLSPDVIDVHLSVPSSQLVFYGALLRHFIHVKEVYFGCYQTPATSADLAGGVPVKGDSLDAAKASPSTRRRRSSEVVVDPRECRPFSVRVSLAIHNLQAHLPMHSNPGGPPCPTAFIDCIGFELDKNFFETKLQLLFSPILLCVFDRCKPFRPAGSGLLNSGRLQLTGFEFRGHAMFSNRGLPLKADTSEYAWLLEITCGTVSGQITTPQVSSLVHCVSNFVFSALDPENAILPRSSGELCQHAHRPDECPLWIAKPPGAETCPTELVLKYRMLRFNLDGVELAVLEAGTCLVIMLDAVRVARCNLHDVHSRDAISVFLPRVQFLQLVKPVDQPESNHTSPFRASQQKDLPQGCRKTKLPWLEAGSLGFGPVHLHSGIAGLDPAYRDSQLYFLRRHDELTHRLWFLWCKHHQNRSKRPASGPYSSHPTNPIRCGCYGNCSFFGPNLSGAKLLDEVMTGTFSRRAVFAPPAAEPIPLVPTSSHCGSTNSIGDPAVHTSRSLGVRFGESLLFPDRLIFQLHDQSICAEYSNGYALMRTEVVRADEAAKFELMPEATDSDLVCTCCHPEDSDSECSSPEEKAFEDSARSSAKTQASSSSNTSDGEGSKPPSRSGDHELSTDPFSNDPLVIQLSNDTDSLHIDSRGRSQNHRRRDRRHKTTGLLASLSLTSLISSVVRPSSSSDESDNPNSSSSSSSRSTCQPPARPQPATPVDSVNPIRLPPTPPPRQHGVATSGFPVEPSLILPSVHSAATVQPLRSDISGPPTVQKQLSEESTLSDDGNTNFVDLQSQLNRPITESTLLRTAYSRHLNCYITPAGSICPELRLRRRWRLCRRFLQGSNDEGDLNSLVGPSAAASSCARAGEEDVAHEKRVGRCRCRIGIARAPEFFCSAAGFSFRSMVDKKAPLPSQTLNSSFCIADLRPLLYPCMLSGTSSSILVSRSSTTVSVLGPVDIFLTPLFVECMDRYISVMVPVMANLPPATVIDELHFKCVRSASQRGKVLYGEGEQSSSQAPPSPSPTSQPSNQPRLSFAPPTVLEARQHQQPQSARRGLLGTRASISTSLEPEVAFRPACVGPSLASAVKNEPTNTVPSASGIKLRSAPADEKDEHDAQEPATRANQFLSLGASRSCSRGHLVEENNLVGLLTLGRINVGFMQIYAIEDVVTVDSMTTGLHDLTCVSLLTLAVDSVKVDILHNARTTHYGTFVDSTFRAPASLIAPVVAAQAPESALETADQNSSTAQARCAEAGSAPTVVSDDATPEFTAASPLLNHELPEPTPGSPHAVAFEERTSIPSATSAQAQAANQRVEEPMFRRLPVVREVRQTARLVCNFSISRIHSQLRRLTRDSNFNPDVLLTAIPFQSSRVFFAFDSDAAAIAARSPLRRGDHPSPLGPPKPLPPPRTAPLPQPAQSFLHGHSAGWIMVECGMEQLSLLFVQRKGFGDSVEEYRPGGGGRNDSNEETMRKTATSASPTDPGESPEQYRQDADAGAASKKPTTEHVGAHQLDEFSRMEEGLGAETSNAVGDQTNQSDSHTRSTVVNPLSDGGEVESRMKNALLMHLHVQTVWLNFPAPKHLPNKRRVEIVRSDWNFLSTVTPTVNAWIGPFNRLVANSKHLHAVSERRHLSVLACLMMEAVSGGDGSDMVAPSGNMQPSPQPQGQLRFSSLEDADFSAYATWRTSASQLLRYDPSCQIFTVLRRYLQSLRAQRGSQFTDTALAEWLREPAVPENILLFRGLLLMLRQCSYCVDIFQPVRLPSVKKGLLNARRSIFRHLRDSTLGKTVEGDATAAAAATASTTTGAAVGGGSSVAVERSVATTTARGPRERWWGQESARMHRPSFAKSLAATARVPSVCGPLASASTDDRTGRTGGVLPRRPSATVLTMFDLMTSENGHWEDKRIVGAPAAREQHQLGVKGDTSSLAGVSDVASDLDDTLDDTTTSEAKGRCESSILSRFLQDTQAGLAEHERETKSNAITEFLHGKISADPDRVCRTGQPRLSAADTPETSAAPWTDVDQSGPAVIRRSTANDTELTAEDFNRVNHLDGQFRFVDDAQRLFRPLLEAIGVNVKGVRRSTLMKKFGGLFAAEGMLETFQIEICDSLDNPLLHGSSEGTGSLPRPTRTEGGPPISVEPRTRSPFTPSKYRSSGRPADPHRAPQALLCHRFSTQLTFRDTVGLSHETGKTALPKPGYAELRSTTTQITAILRFDGIRQHSNLPLLRLLHQFVTMVYCAKDAQESVKRQQPIVAYRRGRRRVDASKESSEDTLTTTGSTVKSRCPAYVRLSGESQRSTPDSTGFQTSSGTGDLPQPVTRTSSSSSSIQPPTATAAIESRHSFSHSPFATDMADQLVATAREDSVGNTSSSPRDVDGKPQKYARTSTSLVSLPTCWRKMLANIELFSTIPEPKNISKKPTSTMPTIAEENALLGRSKVTAPTAIWLPFAHFKQSTEDGDLESVAHAPQGHFVDSAEVRPASVTSREDGRMPVGTSANSVSSGGGHRTDGTPTTPAPLSSAQQQQQQHRFMMPWLRGERIPMVVFVTLNVQQMTVSAVLSELNLTATVRNIHGSFTQTNKIRGRSRFKEISSTSSLSGHCDDADICLTEGSGIHILEVACIQMAPSHVLLSCSRSRRLERNACAICVGRVNVTLPHHPVRLHDMVQRQARHLSSTVSEFLQLPTSPAPQSRKSSQKMFSNVNRNASVPRVSNFVTTDGHAAAATATATYQRHPLVINVSAVTKGLTVSVSLHPSLNAVYEVDPVYFLGQIGPMGFVDITLTKHALSFKSVKLPASFPRAVSIRLPKILTSIAKCQSSGGNCALGPGGERIISQGLTTKEGSYVDIQSTIGTFDQALPSDTLNYIVVVVKLFMKEINEVIRKMAGEQQTWPSVPVTPGTQTDNIYPTPPTSKFAVATRFTFRLKLQGIRLQATTPSGAVKLETTEIHVELSNRIGRTHASWCAESSSSSLARAHGLSRTLVDGTSKPTVKPVHPHHEPISYPAAADAVSCAGCESIVLFARLQHLCLELGYLDQDVLYNERAPEFRTLAFFKTSIALRSLLAEEVSAPQRHTASQKLSTSNARRVNEEGSATAPRSAAVPTAGAPSNYLRSAPPTKPPSFFVGGPSSESQRSTAGGAVPFVDGSTPTGSSVSGASGSGEQEAFLVSLRRPIIWVKPSAFDRGILIWMVYTREFSKWNEQMRKLNAMSGSVSTPASPPLVFRNHSMVYRPRHTNGPLLGSLSPQPTIRSVASTSTASIDNASGSVGSLLKRLPSIASSTMSHEPGPTLPAQTPSVPPRPPVTGPTLFFQLNVEDLGICLPTNILQTSPTSVEVDSRTSVVLTLSRSSLSACLHGSLVSEGEFTDFCLRFDDDFNVGSDDWKPDREKCTIRVRNEEHMVVMNGCVVPSGTSRLCWKALQKLRPDEKARWLVNVQWKMRGLDVHMDHNIGRRLKSLFVTLTTMAGYDGRAPYAQTSTEEETTTVAASAVDATGNGETPSEAHGPPSSSSPSAVEPRRPNTFGAMSMDRLYLGEPLSSDLHNAEAQRQKLEAQYCSSYKRMKWNTLRKRASVLGIPSGRLRRSGSLVASSKERSKGLDHSQMESSSRVPASASQLPGPSFPASLHSATDTSESPTLFDPIDEANIYATASNAGSVYRDAEEMTPGSAWSHDFDAPTPAITTPPPGGSRATLSISEDGEGTSTTRYSELSDQFEEPSAVFRMSSDLDMTATTIGDAGSGEVTTADTVFASSGAPPPPPPRRRPQFSETIAAASASTADSTEAAHTPAGSKEEEENESSLLFELDVHLHVDSGRCVLHPRPGGTPRQSGQSHNKAPSVSTTFMPGGGIADGGMFGEAPVSKPFQPSPSTSIGLSQEEQLAAYLARYRRQLCQDPLQKPTDVSVFYIPAVDVGLHYTSHTKYGLAKDFDHSAQQQQHQEQPFATSDSSPVFEETSVESEVTDTISAPVATAATLRSPLTPVSSFSSQHGCLPVRPSNVGKSADLYATCVLQKLPKILIVHPGLLDFLEQTLENLPLVPDVEDDLESEDSESTQHKSSSAPLNDLLLTGPKSFLVDVVVHVHMQPSTIRFLCLPVSQIQCLITLPSLDVVFSTDRQTTGDRNEAEKPVHPISFRLPSDSEAGIDAPPTRLHSTGGSATLVIGDETARGDVVSVGGLSVTAVLTEFQMVVFHPYGGDASESPSSSWLSTSSGNSLTLKVRDIRLNISRTVRTSRILSGALTGNAATVETGTISDVKAEEAAMLPSQGSAATFRALTSTLAGASGSSGESSSLHSVVRFSGVFDIGVAEFKCDTRRTTEILDIPHAWYRSSLARALFIGQTANLESMEPAVPPGQTPGGESLPSLQQAEEDEESSVGSDTSSRAEQSRGPRGRSPAAPIQSSIIASNHPLDSWLQKTTQASRPGKFRRNAGTTGAQPSVVFRQSPSPSTGQAASTMEEARRRSATAPREGALDGDSFPASAGGGGGGISNTTTLPPRMSSAAPSQGGSLGVVSWQALPIFYVNISHLDVEMYIGSAMGLTRLDARNLFCSGRMYQDSSKRRQGGLGAGVHSCQFVSAKGVVGGEFSLLDLESQVHLSEDPRSDPQHSAELLVGGLQARLEYMNTNIVFLRLSRLLTYLHDDWRLREAEQLLVSSLFPPADTGAGFSSSQAEQTTAAAAALEAASNAAIGAPPVYVMVNGEVTWDQLQLAIARTTTVDLVRSYRKVREYFQDQLREGRLSLIGGQGEYYLRPESSSAMAADSLSLPTESGETHTFETSDSRIASMLPEIAGGNLDKLLQRHWQTPMLEALQACLHHVSGIGPHGAAMRRDILQASTPFESPYFDTSSVPPVLSGSLQLSGKSLAVACFAGNFRSAPDWAVFNLQHPTICFETEAQREAQPRQHLLPTTVAAVPVAGVETPAPTPASTDEVGGWINIRQVLSFDLGQQPQYRPQTAYVLRVRRGREQNPVKLSITPTISEWMEFIFKAVDNTVISHMKGYSPGSLLDVVKLTDFAVNFPSHDPLPRRRQSKLRSRDPTGSRALQRPNHLGGPNASVDGASSSAVAGDGKKPEHADAVSAPPSRANPLKPPADAEILFVLPSISMRLTTDQRQSMARPRPEELLALMRESNRDDHAVGASNEAKKGGTAGRQASPPPQPAMTAEEGQSRATTQATHPPDQHHAGGDVVRGGESNETTAVKPFSAKVNISFQTDFHGVIQLGLIDVPWLPILIASYISEQQHEFENMTTPDPSYAVTPLTLQLAKDGRLSGVSANTSSPIVQDMRTYNVIHWSLSPECRWLLATNIAVPAFDMLLENIGFRRARTTIPKWLQRGALDHLDALVAALVRASLRLAVDDENGCGADGGQHGASPLSLGRRLSRVDVFPRLLPPPACRESTSTARPSRSRNLPSTSTHATNDSTRSHPPQSRAP